MIDYALGFIADNVWILCFLAAGLYNAYVRKDYKPIFHLSIVLAVSFSVVKIVYSKFILPLENLYEIYYLYWAASSIFIAIAISTDHQIRGYSFHWPIKLAISLLLLEMLLNVLVHVDRNVMALNGAAKPNLNLDNAWWLWSLRNYLLNLDNFFIILSLVFPYKAFRNAQNIYKHQFSSIQMDRTFKRIELLEDAIYTMPAGLRKTHAHQCITSARFLLEQWGLKGEDRQHLYCANILCDRARHLAFYTEAVPIKDIEGFEGASETEYR